MYCLSFSLLFISWRLFAHKNKQARRVALIKSKRERKREREKERERKRERERERPTPFHFASISISFSVSITIDSLRLIALRKSIPLHIHPHIVCI